MSSKARLESSFLLSKNTARLFFISLFSFLWRWGMPTLNIFGLTRLLKSEFFSFLLNTYNDALIITLLILLYSVILFFSLMNCSAVRLGEQFIYFTRAQGSRGRLGLLFKYLHPKKAIRAFSLYLRLNSLKLFWFIYFLLPFSICTGCTAYLYTMPSLPQSVYIVLATGSGLLLSLSIVMWRISTLRFSAAPYYFCLNPRMTVTEAIKKSIRFTDGHLADGAILEYSFLGWILSCAFIAPLFYVVPYFKLCKCVYIINAVSSVIEAKKPSYAVKFIKSSEHIN